jgi:hypothetical protein
MAKDNKINAGTILRALQDRHPRDGGEWATFAELNIGTGFTTRRFIDFYAMNVYPSKGYRTIAYEIKTSRADFLKEITDPTKREWAERYAGECYFAVPSGLIEKGEVPDKWGLVYVDSNGGTRAVKIAPQGTPEPFPMSFIASLARRGADISPDIPKEVWGFAGRELNYPELMELARRMLSGELKEEYQRGYKNGVKDTSKQLANGGGVIEISGYQERTLEAASKAITDLLKEIRRARVAGEKDKGDLPDTNVF